jgi:hypothetical protein
MLPATYKAAVQQYKFSQSTAVSSSVAYVSSYFIVWCAGKESACTSDLQSSSAPFTHHCSKVLVVLVVL